MFIDKDKYKFIIISILLAFSIYGIIYFHIFLKTGTVFTQFFYIPIILSALWWQKKGIFVAIFLAILLMVGHNFLRENIQTYNDYYRAIFFILISVIVANLSDKYEKSQQKIALQSSYLTKTNEQMIEEISIRKQAEIRLAKQAVELNSRMRELGCLFKISDLAGKHDHPLEEILEKSAWIIKSSFQHPENTSVRINLESQEFKTDNFKETGWKLINNITTFDKQIATIEICYLNEKTGNSEGSFPEEERNMLKAVTRQLGRIIELKKTENKLMHSEQMSQALLNVTTETIILLDRNGIILAINDIGANRLGKSVDDVIEKCFYDFLPPNLTKSIKKQIHKIIQSGIPHRFEDTRDEIIFDINLYPVFNEANEVKNIGLFAKDITQIIDLHKRIINISESERQNLGLILHDDLGQYFTGISYMATVLEQKMMEKSYDEVTDIKTISMHIQSANERLQKLTKNLYPVSIDAGGFLIAIEEICNEIEEIFNIACRVTTKGNIVIKDKNIANHLFYIAQESINNALTHSMAKKISMDLYEEDGLLSMTIQNDILHRIETDKGKKGTGIDIMKYRANIIGADMEIKNDNRKFIVSLEVKING